jgi:hypothetical protein
LRKWFPSLALLLKEERDAGAPLSSIAKGHFKIDIHAESHAGESIFVPDAIEMTEGVSLSVPTKSSVRLLNLNVRC